VIDTQAVLHLLEWYAVIAVWCAFWITWVLDG
jgi:hypothetical protein